MNRPSCNKISGHILSGKFFLFPKEYPLDLSLSLCQIMPPPLHSTLIWLKPNNHLASIFIDPRSTVTFSTAPPHSLQGCQYLFAPHIGKDFLYDELSQ